MNSNRIIHLSIAFICICSIVVEPCYITNCPWGGKRSVENTEFLTSTEHQCQSCANGAGTCFGPNICCGSDIGCYMGTHETKVCKLEDKISNVPCSTYGKSCSSLKYGKCATENLCCNPETCVPDRSCANENPTSENLNEEQQDIRLKLIRLLKKFMKE